MLFKSKPPTNTPTPPANAKVNASGSVVDTGSMPPIMSEMLISKMAHDLASPAGAVENGLELLEDDLENNGAGGDMANEALGMIKDSAHTVASRLKTYRLAYGTAAGARSMSNTEIQALLLSFFEGEKRLKIAFEDIDGELEENYKKLLFNIVLASSSSLPRGGTVTISWSSNNLRITATSQSEDHAPKEDAIVAFQDTTTVPEDLSPYSVQSYYTGWYAKQQGIALKVTLDSKTLSVSAR